MRRITFPALTLALLGALFTILSPPAEAGPTCIEVRGRVTDAATGQPLNEVTSVGVVGVSLVYDDGLGTNGNSRWSTCLAEGTYKFSYFADSYRREWHHDAPNVGTATVVDVSGDGPIIVNESLVPRGRVIAGRVTNMSGVRKFASVGVWRLTSTGWKSYDGIANIEGNGWYEFRAPGPGRYRINASVDHHWSRWATSETRLSRARTFVLGVHSTFIDDGHIRVPYCTTGGGAFCVPPGFLT
jgi:hypothetical protein